MKQGTNNTKLTPIPEMSPEEFRTAIDLLFQGNRGEVSRWLDHAQDSKVVRRWAGGSVPVSKAATILLRLMINCRINSELARKAALQVIPHQEIEPEEEDLVE
jgi:hypothetical protein